MLIFSNKNEKAKKIMEMLRALLKNDNSDIYCNCLSGNDNMNKRRHEVKLFEQSKRGSMFCR